MPAAIPSWAQLSADNWARASEALIRSDMAVCLPESACSPHLKHGHWKTIPYETVDGLAGTMIWASPLTDAPEVRLPLEVTGWYAIFVGVFSTSEAPSVVWLRLDGDAAAVQRSNTSTRGYGNLVDLFLTVACLDGDSLCIHQQYPAEATACGVAYVKLIPLAEDEIRAVTADRADAATRRLVATNDGFSHIFGYRPTSAAELLTQVALFRGTDFGTLILQSFGADGVAYRSAVGSMPDPALDDFPRLGDRNYVESVRAFDEQGINPLTILIEGAHDAGMKVHTGIRPAGWSFFEPYTEFWERPFYLDHPEWRCFDRDGTPVTRMSWVVPEVRQHLLDLLAEMVGFGADGVSLIFNRGFPLVLFEEPFVALFRARHAVDPRDIEETDPRITALRAEIVTTFMRALRGRLDAEGKSRENGQRLEISAMVLGNEADNLRYGLDLRGLVADGLLDEIYVYPWDFGGSTGEVDMAFYREICTPAGVPFFPSLNTGYLKGKALLEQALSCYEQGAAGITVFDAEGLGMHPDLPRWQAVSRFGHQEELRARLELPPDEVTYTTFHRLGNQIRDSRYGPFWGG